MAELSAILYRVRREIGDPPQPFRSTGVGDGQTILYDLPKQELNEGSLEVLFVSGATQTSLTDYTSAQPWNSAVSYTVGTVVTFQTRFYSCQVAQSGNQPVVGGDADWADVTATAYTVNRTLGKIMLGQPIPLNSTLIVAGTSWSLFSDLELYPIIMESVLQHTYAQETEERYRDAHGFIDYRETPKMLQMLPAIEEPLVIMLSTINAFWTLANDASTDSNIQTAEGTSVDRTTRYTHLMNQIAAMTARYEDYCNQLNVGLYRWETLNLRRTSKTTGRLVPLFKSREYDDHRWPVRLIPAIDGRNQDNSGVPSPMWPAGWGTG
jgi:hypothetical protein